MRRLTWLVVALLVTAAFIVLLGAVIVMAALIALGVGLGVPALAERHSGSPEQSMTGDLLVADQSRLTLDPLHERVASAEVDDRAVRVPVRGRYRCRLHPGREVTWKGSGCSDCGRESEERAAERAARAASRRESREAGP